MEPLVLAEDIGAVRRLTLNRPDKLNALDRDLMLALLEALDAAATDPGVHVVVLRGAGRAFCSGYDLAADADAGVLDEDGWRAVLVEDTRRMLRVFDHPKPIVASVHGYCLAGGVDLMLATDLCVAADDAVFGYVDVRFGSGVVSMFLPWVVGARAAKELLLTGADRVPATEAHRIGLANRVVRRGEAAFQAITLAKEIAAFPQACMRADRMSALQQWDMPEEDALMNEMRGGLKVIASGETLSGAERFTKGEGRHGKF